MTRIFQAIIEHAPDNPPQSQEAFGGSRQLSLSLITACYHRDQQGVSPRHNLRIDTETACKKGFQILIKCHLYRKNLFYFIK